MPVGRLLSAWKNGVADPTVHIVERPFVCQDARMAWRPTAQPPFAPFRWLLVRPSRHPRVTPRGLRIARWYCPEGHRTFTLLLPDFLAAKLPGLLASIDASITVASSFKSIKAAADARCGPDIHFAGCRSLAAPSGSSSSSSARRCKASRAGEADRHASRAFGAADQSRPKPFAA
jgi:hypothetical protein